MIEHSATPEIEDKLDQLFSSLITAYSKSPIVPPANVKMRASAYSRYLVAGEVRSFLHIAGDSVAPRSLRKAFVLGGC